MSLWHLLVIAGNYLLGFILSGVLVHTFALPFPDGWKLGSGFACVLLLTWPIYRRFGFRSPPPPCPREGCGTREYEFVSGNRKTSKWKCKKCGQLLSLEDDSAAILNEDGETPTGYLKLVWPKFTGWWRRDMRTTTPSLRR